MSGPRGTLPVWAHRLLVPAAVLLLVVAIAPLERLAGGRGLEIPLAASLLAAALLVALLWLWLGRIYRPGHLAGWLREKGGRARTALLPLRTRGRLGRLEVVARFGHPFWPSRRLSLSAGGAPTRRRVALVPDVTSVEFVWLADLAALGELDLSFEVREGAPSAGAASAPEPLVSAIRAAAGAAGAGPLPLDVSVRARFLCVGTRGGSWLGARLAAQVEAAHAFTERLVQELSGRFAPLEAERFELRLGVAGGLVVEERSAAPRAPVQLALAALAVLLLTPVPALADLAGGAQFLRASQEADGSWSSEGVRRVQATSEALRLLQQVGDASGARAAAAGFLDAAPIEDTDDLARRIAVLAPEGRDVSALVARLTSELREGGWGLLPEFAADPLDTALALIALAAAGAGDGEAAFSGLVSLVGAQNDDGGWPCVAQGASHTPCTAQALLALAAYRSLYQLDRPVATGVAFLLDRIEADGGFGGGPDSVLHAALATRALLALEDEIAGRRGAVRAFLEGAQQADGSWLGDAYLTALGAGALGALTTTPFCGDGAKNRSVESCDGSDLTGLSCQALGFGDGTLACSASCTFDSSGCAAAPLCGDGLRNQSFEICDGDDLAGESCESAGFPAGGTLACAADCLSLDVSGCTVLPSCGDGVVNQTSEECDIADLEGLSCQVLGLGGGLLACNTACQLDTSQCDAPTTVLDNQGREFVLGFLHNFSSGQNELHLTSEVATTATVEYPLGAPSFVQTVSVMPGQVRIVSLPFAVQNWQNVSVRRNAVRVSSPAEVVVYVINRAQATSDAAMAFPVDALNTEYVVTTYRRGPNGPTEFVVLAPFDDTTVTIVPSQSLPGAPARVPFQRVLNRGEGFFAQANADLTGTTISADRPVAVVNGNRCANIPVGVFACDHIFEIAQPVQTWGRSIPVANLPNRPSGSIYRVVASENATAVTLDGSPLGTIDRGGVLETAPLPGGHLFEANRPIFVTQYMTGQSSPGAIRGDPAMGNMIPPEQYRDRYTFSTVGGAQFVENFLTVVVPDEGVGSVLLDQQPIAAGLYASIPGSGYSAAVVPLSQGTHATSGPVRHGITVEGYNNFDSYLYPGGAQFEFINEFCGDGARNGGGEACDTHDFGGASCASFGFAEGSLLCTEACEIDTSGCIGVGATDDDADGFPLPDDCDDANASVNPGAAEVPGNGVDDDCNPGTPDEIAAGDVACSLATDKSLYGSQETIRIVAEVVNQADGASLAGLAVLLRVEAGGQILESTRRELGALAPGEARELAFFADTGTAPPGPLAIVAELEAGATVASCAASAAIQSSLEGGVLLVGGVTAVPAISVVGDPVRVEYSVQNLGNAAVTPAAIEIQVVDPTQNLVVAQLADTAALSPNASHAATQPLPALEVGDYLIVLRAGAGEDRDTLAHAGLRVVPPPNLPPDCSAATLSAAELWPPNHKFTEIGVQGVTDPDGDPLTVSVYAVTQDEPTDEIGGKCPDALLGGTGVHLRSERLGGGNGRVYRVAFRATDPAGASCTRTLSVCVPHDQSGAACGQGSESFDSAACH